ncbi:MAG: T9SS type A sorting domain-containing protein [Bacteroidia bacterium]|nr:T9SS type A sorting domain-containing protein [Bacteroidia bacterium]
MERNHKQRASINTGLRRNLIVQVAFATGILFAVAAIVVFSLKNETSNAEVTAEPTEQIQILERVRINENSAENSVESFTPLKEVELMTEVFIEFDVEEERLDIDFGRATETLVDLKIYDVFGELVASDKIDPGTTSLTYRLSFIDPGVYTLKTISPEQTIVRKLVVSRDIFK